MMHELTDIIYQSLLWQQKGIRSVLATVVALHGSSYRKPGVRMLISEDGQAIGAVSGGCVEKEIINRSTAVFQTGQPLMMTYDGRYRLGCEGTLYILIEPVHISTDLEQRFAQCISERESLTITSYFKSLDDYSHSSLGSVIKFESGATFHFNPENSPSDQNEQFEQELKPRFRLIIIGGEHDTVALCTLASNMGWEVEVITSIKEAKRMEHFPGATSVTGQTPETFTLNSSDEQTAIVLMTHNFSLDLRYLIALYDQSASFSYLGILGAMKRRNELINQFLEHRNDAFELAEQIHAPAGLNIGAITPQEISISILAEILSVTRNTNSLPLALINDKIHA
ncbi:XdhC family protein [Marinoscillum sp. MHG1-6]|uniref:XdhC family protein n=1 Tax=Marinoscillum sp. MHG1-6 TaxID=2959627 RepID=UPI002157B2D7|nr:XdhC family protein [Marinoscillum sp. MHG1-6]